MTRLFYRLSNMHRQVDEKIRDELRRRAPDSLRVLRLKKLRLNVKDRLARLFQQPRTA